MARTAKALGVSEDELRRRVETAGPGDGRSDFELWQRERDAQVAEQRREQLQRAIPPKYRDVNPATLIEPLRAWDRKRWLYIEGPTGTGKTHQLAALARTMFDELGGQVVWYDAQDLFDRMRESFDDRSRYPRDAHTVRALLIDDLGDENPTKFVATKLSKIVNDRYSHELVLVVTSNYSPGELAARLVTTDGDPAWGKRVASRLAEMCDVVKLGGRDRRLMGGAR